MSPFRPARPTGTMCKLSGCVLMRRPLGFIAVKPQPKQARLRPTGLTLDTVTQVASAACVRKERRFLQACRARDDLLTRLALVCESEGVRSAASLPFQPLFHRTSLAVVTRAPACTRFSDPNHTHPALLVMPYIFRFDCVCPLYFLHYPCKLIFFPIATLNFGSVSLSLL
nr:unnamed protein product [Trypanosoma congolense IL3000]